MFYEEESLDDLLRKIFTHLLKPGPKIKASKDHFFTELLGPVLRLSNPRARLSCTETKGKVYSAIGELLWYLSGENRASFMDYYVPNGFYSKEAEEGTDYVRSGYGERLNNFGGVNQIQNVIDLLKNKQTSRRAVLQLFDAKDLTEAFTSVPCTSTMQFLIRDGKLNMVVNMRSNDAFLGLPHDVFAFTMIQEIIARSVDVELELGTYQHNVGSLHLYENNVKLACKYMSEGWQKETVMPEMPRVDPWPAIKRIRDIERNLREDSAAFPDIADLDSYWQDICRLLYVHRISKVKTPESLKGISDVRATMANSSYLPFLNTKIDGLQQTLKMNHKV